MDQPNLENIHKYERACQNGVPLHLLSVCCTIRQPCHRSMGTSFAQKKRYKAMLPGHSSSIKAAPAIKPKCISSSSNNSNKESVFVDNYSFESPQPKSSNAASQDLREQDRIEHGILDCVYNSQNSSSGFSFSPKLTEDKTPVQPRIQNLVRSPLTIKKSLKISDTSAKKNLAKIAPELRPNLPLITREESCEYASELNSITSTNNNTNVNPTLLMKPHQASEVTPCVDTALQIPSLSTHKLAQTKVTQFPSSEETFSSPFIQNDTSALLRPLSNNPKHTPPLNSKFFATCINSANRSPFKGAAGLLTKSPTIQLGKKVFHVPGSILLGKPVSPSNGIKKNPTRARSRKKKAFTEAESGCDLTLAETSDPYAFVLKKRGTKDAPLAASAQTIANVLLEPTSTDKGNILLDDDEVSNTKGRQDELAQLTPHLLQLKTPLRPDSIFNKSVFSPSPLRNSFSTRVEAAPSESLPESTAEISLLMSDLSFAALPDENPQPEPPYLFDTQKPSVPTMPYSEPKNPFSLVTTAFDTVQNMSLSNASQESIFDVQTFLEEDLGIFAGLQDF